MTSTEEANGRQGVVAQASGAAPLCGGQLATLPATGKTSKEHPRAASRTSERRAARAGHVRMRARLEDWVNDSNVRSVRKGGGRVGFEGSRLIHCTACLETLSGTLCKGLD